MSVASSLTYLETRRDAITAELAALTASSSAGPDFSIDGVSINWTEHKKALLEELKSITELIELYGGPCIVTSVGR